jgi:hypothetical protein
MLGVNALLSATDPRCLATVFQLNVNVLHGGRSSLNWFGALYLSTRSNRSGI